MASKGNLECLNAILIHGVDITTSDPAGMFASRVQRRQALSTDRLSGRLKCALRIDSQADLNVLYGEKAVTLFLIS